MPESIKFYRLVEAGTNKTVHYNEHYGVFNTARPARAEKTKSTNHNRWRPLAPPKFTVDQLEIVEYELVEKRRIGAPENFYFPEEKAPKVKPKTKSIWD